MPSLSYSLLERDLLPDWLIRAGIRRLLDQRLRDEDKGDVEAQQQHLMQFVEELRQSPVAIATREANEQHYELPSEFFELVLGRHLKYSSCYYRPGVDALDEAEADDAGAHLRAGPAARRRRDPRARLRLGLAHAVDGGAVSRMPASRRCRTRARRSSSSTRAPPSAASRNVEVITCDANVLDFPAERRFDRVVSVEMFEHMRNYETLLGRIAGWMRPARRSSCTSSRTATSPIRSRSGAARGDWMARHFFTGGIMPSDDLLLYFQRDLQLARALARHGHALPEDGRGLARQHGPHRRARSCRSSRPPTAPPQARKWWVYWRVFFMSCAELWGYRGGEEWLVSHYLFERR